MKNPSIQTLTGTGTITVPLMGGKKTKLLVTNPSSTNTYRVDGYLNPAKEPDGDTISRKAAAVQASGTSASLLKDIEPGYVEVQVVVTAGAGTVTVECHQSSVTN